MTPGTFVVLAYMLGWLIGSLAFAVVMLRGGWR